MSEAASNQEVLTIGEAAALLRIEERTMARWIVERGVPCAKVGKLLRFRRSALLAWLGEQEQATAATRRHAARTEQNGG
jgi:excisionase family DNA binding protein